MLKINAIIQHLFRFVGTFYSKSFFWNNYWKNFCLKRHESPNKYFFMTLIEIKSFLKNQLLIFLLLFSFSQTVKAQEVIRQVSCFDSTLKFQADSIKKQLVKDGFIVVREASMTMESGYEMPVIVPLNEGSWYHFAFIGERSSRLYELRMFDYDDKQVIYVKHFGEGIESNIISFSYIPKFTEYHVIKPVQVNKKKKENICGYIIMFKKVK